MLNRLPLFWHEYAEMIEIMKTEGVEFDSLSEESKRILLDAFILTMSENRIKEWEKWLELPPTGTIEDRRLQILNYFMVISKMTRESIAALAASLLDGARTITIFKDSEIKITIKPLPENFNKELNLNPLLSKLNFSKPCHIALHTERYYCTWGDISRNHDTWGTVKNNFKDWDEVTLYIPD